MTFHINYIIMVISVDIKYTGETFNQMKFILHIIWASVFTCLMASPRYIQIWVFLIWLNLMCIWFINTSSNLLIAGMPCWEKRFHAVLQWKEAYLWTSLIPVTWQKAHGWVNACHLTAVWAPPEHRVFHRCLSPTSS